MTVTSPVEEIESDVESIDKQQPNTVLKRRRIQELFLELIESQKKARIFTQKKLELFQESLDMKYMMVDPETINDPIRLRYFMLRQKEILCRNEKRLAFQPLENTETYSSTELQEVSSQYEECHDDVTSFE